MIEQLREEANELLRAANGDFMAYRDACGADEARSSPRFWKILEDAAQVVAGAASTASTH